jgi:hypothetical protein
MIRTNWIYWMAQDIKSAQRLVVISILSISVLLPAGCSGSRSANTSAAADDTTEREATQLKDESRDVARQKGFITIEGADLRRKIEVARASGASNANHQPYWIAYAFDAREGVSVDVWLNPGQGPRQIFSAGPNVALDPAYETRNLAVFLLYDNDEDAPRQVEVYNTDTRREFGGHPVYWLGRAAADESLSLLGALARSGETERVAAPAAVIIALHGAGRVGPLLEEIINSSRQTKTRSQAILWLAQAPGELQFLAGLARSQKESLEIRQQAIYAIGVSKTPEAVNVLQDLYMTTGEWALKKQIIYAVNAHRNEEPKIGFLKRVVEDDPDPAARKEALYWLGVYESHHRRP